MRKRAKRVFARFSLPSAFSKSRLPSLIVILPVFLGCLAFCGCSPNAEIMNSGRGTPAVSPSANAAQTFDSPEKDLETMRTADFDFIYVFRRKDGAVLTAEDKRFLKANSPAVTNRFILSDADKAVIAGSKFKFSPENIAVLESYFNIENHSKPESETPPNANAGNDPNAKSNLTAR